MQIFVTHPNPVDSAIRLYNHQPRALKMITETQQILACYQEYHQHPTRILKLDGKPYSTPKSRMNHPVVKWVCKSHENYKWLVKHLDALYTLYDGSGFKNVPDNLEILFNTFTPENFNHLSIQFLNFAKADSKKLDFTHMSDTFEAYDQFLKAQGA